MTNQVVFDDSSLWALLRLAHRDGLVRQRSGVQLRELVEKSDPALERQVLEQLVLTPKVLGFFDRGSLCEDVLEGEFLHSDSLIRATTPTSTDRYEALPMDLITGILQARGHAISEQEFLPRLEALKSVEEERQQRANNGKKFPGIEDHVFKALKHDRLSSDEWAFYRKYQEVQDRISPIIMAFNHAQEVMTAAAEHSASGMVPYAVNTVGEAIRNPAHELSDTPSVSKLVLIRMVAEDIGTLLPPSSLTATLKLAGSPEAEALRYKSTEWMDRLESGELNGIAPIRKEIRSAMRSLEKINRAKTVGSFVTLAAVPVGVAEILLGSPGIAGLTFGAIGTVSEVCIRATEKRYRWALLGKR